MAKPPKHTKVVERKLGRENVYGFAHFEKKLIEIDPRLKARKYLEILIHEKLHIENPEWSEAKIVHQSKEIANLLWNHGYRWVELK
jgi:hypothetical protein